MKHYNKFQSRNTGASGILIGQSNSSQEAGLKYEEVNSQLKQPIGQHLYPVTLLLPYIKYLCTVSCDG